MEWPFAIRASSGYGAHDIKVGGKTRNFDAHHYVCLLAHGQPPAGKPNALHTCNNRPCINPHHVFWGSHQANMDQMRRERRAVGGGRYRQRFFERERAAIVNSPLGLVKLSRKLETDPAYIARIRREERV